MSTDLEQRIAELATSWERDAPTISLAEIRERRDSIGASPDVPADAASGDAVVVALDVPGRRPNRTRRALAAAAVVVVAVGASVLALRSPDDVEPSSPVISAPEPDAAAPGIDVPSPSTPPPTPVSATSIPDPTVREPSSPPLLPAAEAEARLAEIEAEQRAALRRFTTIGFTVTRRTTLPDGSPYETGGPPQAPARVVLRNDGSAAVISESFGISYYDADTGTARAVFTNADGTAAYQQVDGQRDSSMALGVPTGLLNGIVIEALGLVHGVVAIEDDTVGGRDTWRIDQRSPLGIDGIEAVETSTWIDRATGVTLQTKTVGASFIGGSPDPASDGGDAIPLTDVITLQDLVPNEPMPDDFPNPFPPNAQVAVSGDPMQVESVTYEAAAAELGPGAVMPTLAAERVVIERIVFGEGADNMGITVVARWFDGFATTTLIGARYPAMMEIPDSCTSCTEPLLEQVRAAPISRNGITVAADGFHVSITGDPERIRSIVDSLVTVG